MKKLLAVLAVVALSNGAKAQTIYNDQTETLVTNYTATVVGGNVTNATTLVLPASTSGAGYSRIDITPSTNVCIAFNREATTNDVTVASYTHRILSVVGGPYRADAIYLRDSRGGTNVTGVTAVVTVWQINKK